MVFFNRKGSLSMLEIRCQKPRARFSLHRSRANPSKCGWICRSFELSDRFERSANSFIWQFASRSSLFSFRSENQGSLITLERSLNLKERCAQLWVLTLNWRLSQFWHWTRGYHSFDMELEIITVSTLDYRLSQFWHRTRRYHSFDID